MQKLNILIKSITLLYRENELNILTKTADNSYDLVRNVLSMVLGTDKTNQLAGGDSVIINELIYLIKDMIANPNSYDKLNIVQSLEIILKDKPNLIKTVNKIFNVDILPASLKRSIVTLRNTLLNYYNETQMRTIVSKASYSINTNNIGDLSIKEYVSQMVTNLEALNLSANTKDPAIVDELDVGDEGTMSEVLSRVKDEMSDVGLLTTGWNELNDMLQGGFRRGELVMINALQHKYKSGFTQSLFMQVAMNNLPQLDDKTKKPLIVYISLEDDVEVFTSFMYKYLYYNENNELPDLSKVTGGDVAKYIKARLGRTGYHVKLMRINPNEWSYRGLFNKTLEYEAMGYEVHGVFIDYLSKLPTTGLNSRGPTGTDVRELFDRVRNFYTSRRCLVVTPHQISTEGKQLLRNGVPDTEFVKEIAGKGYTSDSKQLDQVVDLELYLHIAKVDRKPVLCVQRGKHRRPGILDDSKFYFQLPFPYKAPIKENLNSEKEKGTVGSVEDEFDF